VSEEFIIHTPNNEASKYWIGGAGMHGKVRH
jgi:acyl-CoA oxidase